MINWTITKYEKELISRIADRAVAMAASEGCDYDRRDAEMDITATHANGRRLKLKELLSAEPLDFAHDVFGIRRHLNRETGELESLFLPRYAAH